MNKALIDECKLIEENSTYTGEIHHIMARDNATLAFRFQLIPALIAAASSFFVVGQLVPAWWGWATVASAFVTAWASVRNPLKDYYEHLTAAKAFTAIRHDARFLADTLSKSMVEKDFVEAVKDLHDRYNDLCRVSPITNDKAFKKAQERIKKDGVYKPDYQRDGKRTKS